MRRLLSWALVLGLAVFLPFPSFGLTTQEKDELKKFSLESRSIQRLLLEKLQESETALKSAKTYSEELEIQRQALIGELDRQNKELEKAEKQLKDSETSIPDLMSGYKAIEAERDLWRVAGISGILSAAVIIAGVLLGGNK